MASDVAPLLNALFWSFAITFGAWIVMQLIEASSSFRQDDPDGSAASSQDPERSGGPTPH